MQITPHVYQCHVADTHAMHPGGTNVYFVGDPQEEMLLIDTGEHDRAWTRQILDFYEQLGRPKITAIVATHGHGDHVGGVDRLHEVMQCPVRCHPKLVKGLKPFVDDESDIVKLRSREILHTGGGVTLRCLFTPGHEVDHVCYYLARERVLFTGDTVLGASSTTVSDLADYMKSLETLGRLRVETIAPAHGPVVPKPRGSRLVSWYINHRNEREQEVLQALEKEIPDVDGMVRDIYPRNLRKELRTAAARNVRTHLEKLKKEERVEETPPSYRMRR